MTTLVVGGVLPSMPMRTPFTPELPTAILVCELAITVSGSSTTTRAGEFSLLTLGVTAWLELISICTLSAPEVTFTFWSWLCADAAAAGFAAGTGLAEVAGVASGVAVVTGLDPGITAGLTAGAGAPGAGWDFAGTPAASRAALLSLACFCCSDFAMLRALSMESAFCATAFVGADPTTIIAIATMPFVSFIAIPTSPPAFRVSSRCQPLKVVDRD